MLNAAQAIRVAAATFLVSLSVAPVPSFCATSVPPAFVPESVTDFTSAARNEARAGSVQHLDPLKYRAFRYLNPDRVVIGAAQSISVTPDGKIEIVPVRGTSVTVRANSTHQEFSHLALPQGGHIADSLLRRSR